LKNIRAISRSHPRLKATERSEVTLEELYSEGRSMSKNARQIGFSMREEVI